VLTFVAEDGSLLDEGEECDGEEGTDDELLEEETDFVGVEAAGSGEFGFTDAGTEGGTEEEDEARNVLADDGMVAGETDDGDAPAPFITFNDEDGTDSVLMVIC